MPELSVKKPLSSTALYLRVLVFSFIIFGVCYAYTSWLKTPNVLNKSTADTSIFLIGLSMILSSVCYFWNTFDPMIKYRKQLGMVGWAYGLTHLILSFSALEVLLQTDNWSKGSIWPAFTGLLATGIFTIMALISNNRMAILLGSKWRVVLRTGYIAMILILVHVVVLRSGRWLTWYQNGMKTLPSASMIVTVFIVIVLAMRVALWISLKRKSRLQI